jgi:hypothetical protein
MTFFFPSSMEKAPYPQGQSLTKKEDCKFYFHCYLSKLGRDKAC